jgi:hypothetical protein
MRDAASVGGMIYALVAPDGGRFKGRFKGRGEIARDEAAGINGAVAL